MKGLPLIMTQEPLGTSEDVIGPIDDITVYAYDQSLKLTDNLVLEKFGKAQVSDIPLLSYSARNISEDSQATKATSEDLKEPVKGLAALKEISQDPTTALSILSLRPSAVKIPP